jgi:ribosomal-protein-alanine N-acetyltransferase
MSIAEPPAKTILNIRTMQPDDLAQVVAIDQLSFSLPWPENAYRYELFENPGSLLWVAEKVNAAQRQIVGMIVVWLIIDEAHIATIAIHPDHRGQGIAAELMATGLAGAIRKQMSSATLEVRLNNMPAQKLYQRFRFEVVGKRVRYYRDNNEDALIMTVDGLGADYLNWLERGAWRNHRGPEATTPTAVQE